MIPAPRVPETLICGDNFRASALAFWPVALRRLPICRRANSSTSAGASAGPKSAPKAKMAFPMAMLRHSSVSKAYFSISRSRDVMLSL